MNNDERVRVSFHRTPSTSLNTINISDGQLIYTTDTCQLFFDVGSNRKELAGYRLEKPYDTDSSYDPHILRFYGPNPDLNSYIEIITADTTYTARNNSGIGLSGTEFFNEGVRNIKSGEDNGNLNIDVNGVWAEVTVKGIAALAFKNSADTNDITSGVLPIERGGIGVNNLNSGEAVIGNGTSGVTTRPIDTVSGGTVSSNSLITSGAVYSGLANKLDTSLKGANNGLAELGGDGKVLSSQLPSYVDDVIEGYYYNNKFYEESTHTTEITGEIGKIYLDLTTDKSYRWSGSTYVFIGSPLALGTDSSSAYRGDYGNTAYLHATDANRLTTVTAEGLYKIAATSEGHVANLSAVQASDLANIGVSITDTTYTLGADAPNNQITLTPSSGTVQNITVPYASNAGTVNGVSVPMNAQFTDTTYNALSESEISAITGITFDNYDGRSF